MAILEIHTASDARKLLLALVGLVASKLPLPYSPIRMRASPGGLVTFDFTEGHIEGTIKTTAIAPDPGPLLFHAAQVKALAATLTTSDKRPGFDLWLSLAAVCDPGPDAYFPAVEKVRASMGALGSIPWGCFDLALLSRLKPVLDLTTSFPPAKLQVRSVKTGLVYNAGPVSGVLMGCRP